MKACPFCAENIQDAAVVCKHCNRELALTAPAPRAHTTTTSPPSRSPLRGVLFAALLGASVFAAVFVLKPARESDAAPVELTAYVRPPLVLTVADEPAREIAPGAYASWSFDGRGYARCRLTGRVLALAGGQKDVAVVLLTADEFLNMKNKNKATAIFESPPATAVPLDLALDGSQAYVLVVSNTWSMVTMKTVQMQAVTLHCVD